MKSTIAKNKTIITSLLAWRLVTLQSQKFATARLWPIVWVSSITCIGKSKAYQVVDLREADVFHAINVRYWNTQIHTENFRRKLETELGDLLQLKISWIIESFLFYPKLCPSQIKEIQQAGLYFRDALLPNISTMSWPPKPAELCESAVKLPEELDALYTLS